MANLNLNIAEKDAYIMAKKILSEKKENMYIEIIQVLTNIAKCHEPTIQNKINEEHLKIWVQAMPLLFHKDKNIQNAAINAFESIIPFFSLSKIENYPDWPTTKTSIIDIYSKQTKELLNGNNSNWYKIWSILIRILNKSTLKAAAINSFLAILEEGFRSDYMSTRAEAFICWKELIHVYSMQEDTFTQKQIKILCIPLNPSQSKSLNIAINKFSAWWFLLCKINNQYYQTTLKPYLIFCFGNTEVSKESPFVNIVHQSTSHLYPSLSPMSITSLIYLLATPNDEEKKLFNDVVSIETNPNPFTTGEFKLYANHIIRSCTSATYVMKNIPINSNEICKCLWKYLLNHVIQLNDINIIELVLKQVEILIEERQHITNGCVENVVYIIGTVNIIKNLNNLSDTKWYNVFTRITNLICDKRLNLIDNDANVIVEKLFNIKEINNLNNFWLLLKHFTEIMENGKIYNVTMVYKIWMQIAANLPDCFNKKKLLKWDDDNNINMVFRFCVWPLLLTKGNMNVKFNENWLKLIQRVCSIDENIFWKNIHPLLIDVINAKNFQQINDIVALLFQLIDSKSDTQNIEKLFEIINKVIETPSSAIKDLNSIGTKINLFTKSLKGQQFVKLFPIIQNSMHQIEQKQSLLRVDDIVINEYKNVLNHHMKNKKTQELVKLSKSEIIRNHLLNLINVSNNDDEFVFIKTDWKLKPNKLTDHQKEKMAQRKSDIPALYNDLSQSQDGSLSIKEWSSSSKKSVIPIISSNNDDTIIIQNNTNDKLNTLSMENDQMNTTSMENVKGNNTIDLPNSTIDVANTILTENNTNASTATLNDSTNDTEDIRERKKRKKIETELKKLKTNAVFSNEILTESLSKRRKTNVSKDSPPNPIKSTRNDLNKSRRSNHKITETASTSSAKKTQQLKSVKNDKPASTEKTANSSNNDSIEIIESSQQSQSVISGRKSLSSRSKKSICFDNKINPDNQELTSKVPQNEINKNNIAEMDTMPNTEIIDLITNDKSVSTAVNDGNGEAYKNHSYNETNATIETNANILTSTIDHVDKNDSNKNIIPSSTSTESIDEKQNSCEIVTLSEEHIIESTSTIDHVNANADKNDSNEPLAKNVANASTGQMESIDEKENSYEMATQPLPEEDANKNTNESTPIIENDDAIYEMSTQPLPQEHTHKNDDDNNSKTIAQKVEANDLHNKSLSPILNKSTNMNDTANQSIISSLNCNDIDERNKELISSTIDISPILRKKSSSVDSSIESIDLPVQNMKKSSLICIVDSPISRKKVDTIRTKIVNDSPKSRQSNICTPSTSSSSSSSMQSPCSSKMQFKGRAAQMITLANSKRSNSPIFNQIKFPTNTNNGTATVTTTPDTNKLKSIDSTHQQSSHHRSTTSPELTYEELLARNKDLLTFSKELPSPYQSPGISILKRKMSQEDAAIDDTDAQANKRKRVSFLDPPVSATKEFIRHIDENPTKISINVDENSSAQQQMQTNSINTLKRKNRAESMLEIAKYSNAFKFHVNENQQSSTPTIGSPVQMESLRLNSSIVSNPSATLSSSNHIVENNNDSTIVDDDISITPSPILTFSDKSSVLQYVFEEFSLKDIFKKYTETDQSSTIDGNEIKKLFQSEDIILPITRELSNAMIDNKKIQTNVLEQLADKHSIEFLNYAVQENRSTDVLNRLTFDSILQYVYDKIDVNDDAENIMKNKIIEKCLLKNNCKQTINYLIKNDIIKLNIFEELNDNNSIELINYVIANNESKTILNNVNFDNLLNFIFTNIQNDQICQQNIIENYGESLMSIFECINDKTKLTEHIKSIIIKVFYKILEYTDENAVSNDEYHKLLKYILSNRKITSDQFVEYSTIMIEKHKK